MSLPSDKINAVEAALAAFDPTATDIQSTLNDLLRTGRQYQMALAQQNPSNGLINLLTLKQHSPAAYAKVAATLTPAQTADVAAFAAQYAGQALPAIKPAALLSGATALPSIAITAAPIITKPPTAATTNLKAGR